MILKTSDNSIYISDSEDHFEFVKNHCKENGLKLTDITDPYNHVEVSIEEVKNKKKLKENGTAKD